MSEQVLAIPRKEADTSFFQRTMARVLRYILVRGVTLFITVIIGVYLTILVANMGGYVDQIRKGEIRETITVQVMNNPAMRNLGADAKRQLIEERIRLEEKRLGLDQPFLIRSFRFLENALTLRLGFAQFMNSNSGSRQVKLILLERLPVTLLLFGLADLFLFFLSLFLALILCRQYGSFWDRLFVVLSPTSSAPGWFYGIFLILIFAGWLRLLPFGDLVDAPTPPSRLLYALSVGKHLILPIMALTISSIFLSVYSWRTFFLIYSSEDYVELAKAKGLSGRAIERRYIMRPTLPTIVTNFLLTVISLWTGAPIFETVFNWPGLGRALYQAVGLFDVPVIVGSTVIFAYLLAVTVFLLDIIYAILDPRVRVGA
ncbi:MAG: ABC transporter permease [Anaerolineae bacterium]